jgi:tRNA G37 N-methylase TrmD
MIPSNELRIGNYVLREGRLERLVMINTCYD